MAEVAWTWARIRALRGPPAARAGAIAARQHGVISRPQLRDAGIAPTTITRWVDTGHLFRLYRGVYAAGHPQLSREGRWMAAVLAGGVHSFLSHWSSAEALGIVRPGTRRPIHLSTSVRSGGSPPGLDHGWLVELCERAKGRRGAAAVRALIDAPHLPLERTRSGPECEFLEICHDFGIRSPEVNVPLLDYEVDFLWRRERFVVEIDGGHHERPEQRDRDHRKDARLGQEGFLVRRFRPVTLRPAAPVAAEVTETLAARDPGPT